MCIGKLWRTILPFHNLSHKLFLPQFHPPHAASCHVLLLPLKIGEGERERMKEEEVIEADLCLHGKEEEERRMERRRVSQSRFFFLHPLFSSISTSFPDCGVNCFFLGGGGGGRVLPQTVQLAFLLILRPAKGQIFMRGFLKLTGTFFLGSDFGGIALRKSTSSSAFVPSHMIRTTIQYTQSPSTSSKMPPRGCLGRLNKEGEERERCI